MTKIKISREQEGLAVFLFPDRVVIREPQFAGFALRNKILVLSSRKIPEDLPDCVQVTPSGEEIDNPEAFIKFLREKGISVSKASEMSLMVLDEETFWKTAKIIWVTKRDSDCSVGEKESTFELFRTLFNGFADVYRVWRSISSPYPVVFSALCTMMARTVNPQAPGISPGYRKVLIQNKTYLAVYQRAVLDYLDTDKTEEDFIEFLMNCSERYRR